MTRASTLGIGIGIALAGCASPAEAPGHAGSGGDVPSPFNAALERFQNDVASAYGRPAADLAILPASEDVVGFDDQNTGDLIAFEATAADLRVRGFANKSTVVFAKQGELGPLFQAAHALDAATSLSAQDLAARIVWMIGPDTQLVASVAEYPTYPLPAAVAPPSLERTAGGAALHFYYIVFDRHTMGAPPTGMTADVTCSSGYHAALVTSPGP